MWNESSLNRLYNSALTAFPHTKKRQYATDTIAVTRLEWMPYIGMRTLFLKGHVQNFADNGGEYDPIILFKNVQFHPYHQPGLVEIISSDTQQQYFIELLSGNKNDVSLRCSCGDYLWRFNYYNSIDKSHYGKVRKAYEGAFSINPKKMPGICKHLMALSMFLREAGLITGLQFRG